MSTRTTVRSLPTKNVFPNPDQPRKFFDEEKIAELAASIQKDGLMQPITVVKKGEGFMIVAGERRWRAHCKAEIKNIPAIVKEMSDEQVATMAIIENLQRQDITPIEQARAYKAMLDNGYAKDTKELAEKLGLKQPWRITERMALLKMIEPALEAYESHAITQGQAGYIASLPKDKQQKLLSLCLAGKCSSTSLLSAAYQRLRSSSVEPQETMTLDLGADVEKSNELAMSHKRLVSDLHLVLSSLGAVENSMPQKMEYTYGQLEELEQLLTLAKSTVNKIAKQVESTLADSMIQ